MTLDEAESGQPAPQDPRTDTTPPHPPEFRRGDPRRDRSAAPDRCVFCGRHPRRPASARGGPRPQHCATVWGRDFRDRDVTCARLDDAHDLWLAVYGGTGPLAHLDVDAQRRHLAELRTALESAATVLDPIRADLDRLDDRLSGEVAGARAQAHQAVAEADQARAAQEAATAARDEAYRARDTAQTARDDARAAEAAAITARDDATAAAEQAVRREQDADTRAQGAHATARQATESLQQATARIAEQATRLGELSGAQQHLNDRLAEQTAETTRCRDGWEQQRLTTTTALASARADADAELSEQRARHDRALAEAWAAAEQAADARSAAHAGVLRQETNRAEQAERAVASLRTTVLTALATAPAEESPGALRARVIDLVSEPVDR